MRPIDTFPEKYKDTIRYILTDIDDTLTTDGRLPAQAYGALEALEKSGRQVVPITGRPAGWCDHIARMWPVAGIVGENGAFAFSYDHENQKITRLYWKTEEERRQDRLRLEAVRQDILEKVPKSRVSADQKYREADLAIDFCEDIDVLEAGEIQTIVECFRRAGAQAKISSIHVNGWFGEYDKLSMTRNFFAEILGKNLDMVRDRILYIGDSPNDCPMFAFFPHSVGVANILDFKGKLSAEPTWITSKAGGLGFAEMAALILASRQ